MSIYNPGIPPEFAKENGYQRLLELANKFTNATVDQDYRKSTGARDEFITAAVGLVVLLERASYIFVEKNDALQQIMKGIYLPNYFALMAPEGQSKNSVRFLWCYLTARFLSFPVDLVDTGLNELGLLRLSWKEDQNKSSSIQKFMAGYAAFGIENKNFKVIIWNSFRDLKRSFPLRLLNRVLHSFDESDSNLDLKVWALQEKLRYARANGYLEDFRNAQSLLLDIYKKKELPFSERVKLYITEQSGTVLPYIILTFALLGLLLRPVKLIIRRKKFEAKLFIRNIWNTIKGKNEPWEQVSLFIIVFVLSSITDSIKKYRPPLESFQVDVRSEDQ